MSPIQGSLRSYAKTGACVYVEEDPTSPISLDEVQLAELARIADAAEAREAAEQREREQKIRDLIETVAEGGEVAVVALRELIVHHANTIIERRDVELVLQRVRHEVCRNPLHYRRTTRHTTRR